MTPPFIILSVKLAFLLLFFLAVGLLAVVGARVVVTPVSPLGAEAADVEACSVVVGSAGAVVLTSGIGAEVALIIEASATGSLDGGLINIEEVGAEEGSGRAGIPLDEEGRMTE